MTMHVEHRTSGNTQIPAWTFGDRLRKARTHARLKQAQFAEAIGVGEGSLAAWETDRARPRDIVAVAQRVEGVTDIPAAWLLGLLLPRVDSNHQPFECDTYDDFPEPIAA